VNARIEARRFDEIRHPKRTTVGGGREVAIDLEQLRDRAYGLDPELPAICGPHREPAQRHAAQLDLARAEHDALDVLEQRARTREREDRVRHGSEASWPRRFREYD
jgi:hypothetical protein